MKRILRAAAAALLLPSIAYAEPTAIADLYPADYDAQVRARLELSLKDYGSAIIKPTRAPRATMMNVYDKLFGKPVPSHVACYIINAKNSYGGYVGFRSYAFAFVNGKIVNSWEYREATRPIEESAVSRECLLPPDPAPPDIATPSASGSPSERLSAMPAEETTQSP